MLNHEKLKKTKDGARGGAGWKTAIGANRVFILPPATRFLDEAAQEELGNLALQCKMHYFKIEGRPTEVSLCLEEQKQRCPACEVWRMHRKSEDPGLKEMAREVSPSDQYLFNMIDINNMQAGVQGWSANYTCWTGIMSIAGNPMWGNVIDPANGVIFGVTMKPGTQTKTGRNQYEVNPEPVRATMMGTLDALPAWREMLDALVAMQPVAKEAEEIRGLLDESGFPPVNAPQARSALAPVQQAAPVEGIVTPAAAPVVVAPTGTASPPVTVLGQPAVAAPAPVTPVSAPVAVTPAAAPEVVVQANTAPVAVGTVEVHYDPGPEYVPKLSDAVRPANVPRCYGDYNKDIHRCVPCPAISPCQLQKLGVPAE